MNQKNRCSSTEEDAEGTLVVLGVGGAVGYLRAKPVRAERAVCATPEDAPDVTGGPAAARL